MQIFLLLLLLSTREVIACDTPNDAGGAITVRWETSKEDTSLLGYEIWRSDMPDSGFEIVGYVGSGSNIFRDMMNVENGKEYYYKIRGREKDSVFTDFSPLRYLPLLHINGSILQRSIH